MLTHEIEERAMGGSESGGQGTLAGAALGSVLGAGGGGMMAVQLDALLQTVGQIQAQHPELQAAFTGAMQVIQQIQGASGGRVPELKKLASQAVEQQTQSAQTVSERVGQTSDDYKTAHDKAQGQDEDNGARLKQVGVNLDGSPAAGTQAAVDQANQRVRERQAELGGKREEESR